jgi:hypothetical protein
MNQKEVKYYTGVGSRSTPPHILTMMGFIANKLSNEGYVLRSGAAKGADTAFENSAGANKQIFVANHATPASMDIASKFHPAWHRCSTYAKKLHGRNSFQVLGPQLNQPSQFLICWTPDGCKSHKTRKYETGGTGTAISIADAYGTFVYNLANMEDYYTWLDILTRDGYYAPILERLYTSTYRYPMTADRTDITVKGNDKNGRFFAPRWDMVMGHQKGTVSDGEYTKDYWEILNNVPPEAWYWFLSVPERTLVCFCNENKFCHRNILVNYVTQVYPSVLYDGWRISG